MVGGHLIGVHDGPEMQACVSAITSFCQKQSEASVSRIRTEDVLEDSSRNTRDVEGAKALIAVHDGTPFGLGEGRDAAQGREHVQEVPLPPHIVVEDVGDKEDERPSEAAVGEGGGDDGHRLREGGDIG